MATIRDFDQMLKTALELKDISQKFIDFAKLQGAGEGDEGEEDLREPDDSPIPPELNPKDEEDTTEEDMPKKKPKHLAIILALKKKMGKM